MDPASIAAGCVGLVGVIGKVSLTVGEFVHNVREARHELDAVSRELGSLRTILEILRKDIEEFPRGSLPSNLGTTISAIVIDCRVVVEQIDSRLKTHMSQKRGNRTEWTIAGKENVDKLRAGLETHKRTLDLALNMVEVSLIKDVKKDTSAIHVDTTAIRTDVTAVQESQVEILRKLAELQVQVKQGNTRTEELVRDGNSGIHAGIEEKYTGVEEALRQLNNIAMKSCEDTAATTNYRTPNVQDDYAEELEALRGKVKELSMANKTSQAQQPSSPLPSDPPPAYTSAGSEHPSRPSVISSYSAPSKAQDSISLPYRTMSSLQSLLDMYPPPKLPESRPSLPQRHSDILGLGSRSSGVPGMAPPPIGYNPIASLYLSHGTPLFPPLREEPPANPFSGPIPRSPFDSLQSDPPYYSRPHGPKLPSITLTEYTEPFGPSCACCAGRIQLIHKTLSHPSATITLAREDLPAAFLPPDFISFSSPVVSRSHCKLSVRDNQWYIQDLGSSSGTQINTTTYREPGFESPLLPIKTGDIIQLGTDFHSILISSHDCVRLTVECDGGNIVDDDAPPLVQMFDPLSSPLGAPPFGSRYGVAESRVPSMLPPFPPSGLPYYPFI